VEQLAAATARNAIPKMVTPVRLTGPFRNRSTIFSSSRGD
jgi:hypothetical protein